MNSEAVLCDDLEIVYNYLHLFIYLSRLGANNVVIALYSVEKKRINSRFQLKALDSHKQPVCRNVKLISKPLSKLFNRRNEFGGEVPPRSNVPKGSKGIIHSLFILNYPLMLLFQLRQITSYASVFCIRNNLRSLSRICLNKLSRILYKGQARLNLLRKIPDCPFVFKQRVEISLKLIQLSMKLAAINPKSKIIQNRGIIGRVRLNYLLV